MNVFVLSTGRCGSVTFYKACSHIENYTSDHESKCQGLVLAGSRLNYADNHIEADPRLSYYLGPLEQAHGKDAFYVHLARDPTLVAESYLRKLMTKKQGQARA